MIRTDIILRQVIIVNINTFFFNIDANKIINSMLWNWMDIFRVIKNIQI